MYACGLALRGGRAGWTAGRAGSAALASTHPVRRLRTAARRWHGEARLRCADPAAEARAGPRGGSRARGRDRGRAGAAKLGEAPLRNRSCAMIKPALSPWESHDITRVADEVYGLPIRMHVAEFQHSFAVSVRCLKQADAWRAEGHHRRCESAEFTSALPYWRSPAQASGRVQVPVRSARRSGTPSIRNG